MKAVIENKKAYEVTGERGDFWICKDGKGKVRMFAKHLVEVSEVEKIDKPKYREASVKPRTDEQVRNHEINRIKEWLPALLEDSNGGMVFLQEVKDASNANEMVNNIASYAMRAKRISEKQAYVVARFAVENDIEFNVNNR